MTSNVEALPGRNLQAFWYTFATSALLVVMVAGATLAAIPAVRAAARPPTATAAPLLGAYVYIAKPTYTPSPEPTFTPTLPPTPTVEPVLADTAAPELAQNPLQINVVGSDLRAAPQPGSTGKLIFVSISDQHLYAYQDGNLVFSFVASTGMGHSTRIGDFSVLDKIPNAYGSTWNIWMPNWLGIYYAGTLEDGIHALPILPSGDRLWSGFLGTPISFGCVVLGVDESLELYNWADVGTPVQIRR